MKKICTMAMALILALNASAALTVKQAAGWLESAWMEFSGLSESYKHYNAYVSADNGSSWTALDGALVRKYQKDGETYGRVDALGLAVGTNYKLKVVPVNQSNAEVSADQVISESLNVQAHDRVGFAHFNRSNQSEGVGAYNDNGTLKSGARVLYVTAANAKTVTLGMHVDKVDQEVQLTGLQAILDGYSKSNEVRPLAIRIIGCIKKADLDGISSSAEGLQVKGKNDYYANKRMNLTIEGVGNDASISGFGMLLRYTAGLELRNFAVLNCMDDCISIDTGNEFLWIHNLDLFYGQAGGDADQAKGDGTIDLKGESRNMTISYNHFWDSGKSSLCGMGSAGSEEACYNTYHHNWFDHSDSRHPRIRSMSIHVFNNYYDGNAKYGVGVTNGASCFVENNYFRNCKYPMLSSQQGSDINTGDASGTFSGENSGVIKAYGNYMEGYYRYITYQQANSTSTPDPNAPAVRTGGGFDYSSVDLYTADMATIFTNLQNITIVDDPSKAGKHLLNLTNAGAASFTMAGGIVWSWSNSQAGVTMAKHEQHAIQSNGSNRVITIPSEAGDVITIKLRAAVTTTDLSIEGVEESVTSFAVSNTFHATGVVTLTCNSNVAKFQAIKYTPEGAPAADNTPVDATDWDAWEATNRNDQVPSTVLSKKGASDYNNFDQSILNLYTPQAAQDVPATVTGAYGAGRVQHGDLQWVFDNATEDSNYDIIPGLKTAVTNYSNTALQGIIGNSSVNAGGDEPGENPGENPGEDPVDPTPVDGDYCGFFEIALDNSEAQTMETAFNAMFDMANSTAAATVSSSSTYYMDIKQTAKTTDWGTTVLSSKSCNNIQFEAKNSNANKTILKAYSNYIQPNGKGVRLIVSQVAEGDTVVITIKSALNKTTLIEGATVETSTLGATTNEFYIAAGQTQFIMYSNNADATAEAKWQLQSIRIKKADGSTPSTPGDDPVDPVDPQPSTTSAIVDFQKAVGTFTKYGTCTIGEGGKYATNTTAPAKAMKFANSLTGNDGSKNYVSVVPTEGGFLAGDTVKISHYYNNSAEKVTAVALYDTTEALEAIWTTQSSINGRLVAGTPALETYVLTANYDSLIIARNGGTTTYVLEFIVTRPEQGPDTPTAIDTVENNNLVSKFFRNGQIFILRGEELYTISGVRVE